MAYRNYFPLRGVNFHEPVLVAGSFTLQSSTGAVALTQQNGAKFTVSKTANGKYTVTLQDNMYKIVSAMCDHVGVQPVNTQILVPYITTDTTASPVQAVNIVYVANNATSTTSGTDPSSFTGIGECHFVLVCKLTKSPN